MLYIGVIVPRTHVKNPFTEVRFIPLLRDVSELLDHPVQDVKMWCVT